MTHEACFPSEPSNLLRAAQQSRAKEAERIIEQLQHRRGVTIAVCPGISDIIYTNDFFRTYPLGKSLAMIESYVHNFPIDELQVLSMDPDDVIESESLLETCLDALRASSTGFSLMIHIQGWDVPKLHVGNGAHRSNHCRRELGFQELFEYFDNEVRELEALMRPDPPPKITGRRRPRPSRQ